MFDKSLTDVLKIAEKWGVKYKLNSKTPGFFTLDSEGNRKETSIEEILAIDTSTGDIDTSISEALRKERVEVIGKSKVSVESEYTYFNMHKIDEVYRYVS